MTWEDLGLYFTLILNSIVVTVFLIVAYVIHRSPAHHRIMRPNRVESTTATFFSSSNIQSFFKFDEDVVANNVGAESAIYVMFLKFKAYFFVSCFIGTIVIVSLCATDDYLNVFDQQNDPKECRLMNRAECDEQSALCVWINNSTCEPKRRTGLFQFSVQNLTPENWRLWLYSICVSFSAIQMGFLLYYFVNNLKSLLIRHYTLPMPTSAKYAALATVGARTVMIQGLDPEDELLNDQNAFLKSLREAKLPAKKGEEDKPLEVDPSADLAQYIQADSLVLVREPPKKMLDLIEDYKEAVETLKDTIAAEKNEEDEEKKPLKKRVPPVCCKAVEAIPHDVEALEKVSEELRPLIEEAPKQPYLGIAIMTFDTPSNAFDFVDLYNKSHAGALSKANATILGNIDGVIWSNLPVSGVVGNIRWLVMIIIFVVLVFFWGIPVAFLGSLDSLATLPGIGPVFEGFVNSLPVTLRGILSAYLPTIVITVFNILLPVIIRLFARVGGVRTMNAMNSSALWMYFIFTLMSGIIIQAAIQGGLGQLAALLVNPTRDTVFAFVIAIVSPSGGYWYAFLITAGCLATYLKLLLLAPLILSKILGKLAGRQEAYDRLFEPRVTDFPIISATHLFFFAIGMLFHGTVPFLVPFGFIYFFNGYLVERSLILDGGAPSKLISIDFTMIRSHISGILMLHTVAAVGNVLTCVMKLHWGGTALACIGLVCSIAMHVFARVKLANVLYPTAEKVRQWQPLIQGELEPCEKGFVPEYTTFKLKEDVVDELLAKTYTIDRTWPRGAEASKESPKVIATEPFHSAESTPAVEPVKEEGEKDANETSTIQA